MKIFKTTAILLFLSLSLCYARNDTSHESPDSYYSSADESSPENLRNSLHLIIQNHKVLKYKQIWNALKDTDRDPENQDNVILIYTGKSIFREDNNGRQRNNNNFWNREHVWPKSHGFKDRHLAPFTDLHHLKPADKTVNSSRGNKDFDEGGSPQGEAADTKTGRYNFYPRPEVRGDIARMLFYMDVRYEGTNGEPDLVLVDRTGTSGPFLGKLCTLYRWHLEDPVDEFEKRRNERIYFYQKNRNPFIDRPNYASILWGRECER